MSAEAALERVRSLAQSWATLPRQEDDLAEHLSDIDRRVGAWLLSILEGDPARALEGARVLAEDWLRPGAEGLFYPAAGQAVLDAIRGGSTPAEGDWRARAETAEAKLARIAELADTLAPEDIRRIIGEGGAANA